MPLDLGDLNNNFDGAAYATINGKKYRFPPVSAALGVWGRKVAALQSELGDDPTREDLERIKKEAGEPPIDEGLTTEEALLSPAVHAELLADGVDDEMVKHVTSILYARLVGGDKVALAWAHGEVPKAPTNRAERRAAKKAAPRAAKKVSGSGTMPTDEAPTTPSRASGRTTSTRKASSGTKKAASPGRKS